MQAFCFAATMARLAQEIQSSQRFLQGLSSLPNFDELRQKQATRLLREIRKVQLPVELAARVLDQLDVVLWGDAIHADFIAAVADRTIDEDPASNVRAKLQDFCQLPFFLSQQWWDVLESRIPEVHKLESLCKHVAKLGLRHPTEATYGALLVLSFYSINVEVWYEADKLQLVETHKGRMKKMLQQESAPSVVLQRLPTDVSEMPHVLLNAAYPDGFVAGRPSLLSQEKILHLIVSFPLRKTNRAKPSALSTASAAGASDARMLSAAMNALANVSTAIMQQQQQQQRATEVSLPGFKMLKSPSKSAGAPSASGHASGPLALEDPKHCVDKDLAGSVNKESEVIEVIVSKEQAMLMSPRSTIAALKDQIPKPASEVTQETRKAPAKKQPVKKHTAKSSSMRRPAAAHQVLRRPAAAVSAVSDRQGRRDALLRTIPQNVLDRFKGGCSTCRNRPYCTVSCWRKRGFTL